MTSYYEIEMCWNAGTLVIAQLADRLRDGETLGELISRTIATARLLHSPPKCEPSRVTATEY